MEEIFNTLEELLIEYAPTANVIRERYDEIRIEKDGYSSTVICAACDCSNTVIVYVGSVPAKTHLAIMAAGGKIREISRTEYHAIF